MCVSLALWFASSCLADSYESSLSPSVFEPLIAELVVNEGFEATQLRQWFKNFQPNAEVLRLISKPAEALTWDRYRKILIKPKRISEGKIFLQKHAAIFEAAEKKFGVDKHILAAIMGIETSYGKNQGRFLVLESLSTLAFYYPPELKRQRANFFRSELIKFLKLCRDQGWEADKIKGSYAGAMGMGQFISSSYQHYAVDFDGDNQIDLFNSIPDAIGSVGNYFKSHGWKNLQPTAVKLKSPGANTIQNTEQGLRKPKLALKTYFDQGALPQKILSPRWKHDDKAVLYAFTGEGVPEYWLTTHNFYVITRYNHSPLYAMAAYQLSEALM